MRGGGLAFQRGLAIERRQTGFWQIFWRGAGSPAPPRSPTIGQILDGYLADRKDHVSPSAYTTLSYTTAPIRRHLGDLDANNLTRERARLYARQRRAEGYEVGPPDKRRRKPIKDGTILREIGQLRAALKWAVGGKWIQAAPHVPAPSAPVAKERWLTRDEFDALLAGARSPHIRLFILLALHTGARSGALLELTWSAVDLERGRIDLGRGRGNKGRAVVPINDELRVVLNEAKAGAVQPEDRSAPTVIQEHGRAVKSIQTGFRAAAARADLVGVTPHVLRHTAATWMAEMGVPMRAISLYLGHTNEKTTEAVYAQHTPDYLKAAAAALTRQS